MKLVLTIVAAAVAVSSAALAAPIPNEAAASMLLARDLKDAQNNAAPTKMLEKRSKWDLVRSLCVSCGSKANRSADVATSSIVSEVPDPLLPSVPGANWPNPPLTNFNTAAPQAELKAAIARTEGSRPILDAWNYDQMADDAPSKSQLQRFLAQEVNDNTKFKQSFDQRKTREPIPLERGKLLDETPPPPSPRKSIGKSPLAPKRKGRGNRWQQLTSQLLKSTSESLRVTKSKSLAHVSSLIKNASAKNAGAEAGRETTQTVQRLSSLRETQREPSERALARLMASEDQ